MVSPTSIKSAIKKAFDNKALVQISVPILQPADPFLDMVGEDLRRRIFMTENENGDSLCLRPEYTIPVCLEHIATQSIAPHQYAYVGEVFRQSRLNGRSFYQAGIEDLGDSDEAIADARSLNHALDILNSVLGNLHFKIILGDQTVFAAVLEALGIPHGWQKKLLRAFGNDEKLRQMMTDLSAHKVISQLPKEISQLVDSGDEAALIHSIEQEMRVADISPSGGRSPREIAKRLIENQKLSSVRLEPKALSALQEFLDIEVPLDQAEERLTAFGKDNALHIEKALAPFRARNQAFVKVGVNLSTISYGAAFGRPLDYYTGMVYEIKHGNDVLVGGGRYDRLLTMLGAKQSIPAVGFSIWLDRLEKMITSENVREVQ